MLARVLFGTLLSGFVFGCRGQAPLLARDSEGRAFRVNCTSEQTPCLLTQESGPQSGHVAILRADGRLLGVCDSGDGRQPLHPASCRPLICTADADCPRAPGALGGSCVGDLCIDPTKSIGTADAVMLCLAGTGLGHEQPRQIDRYALAANCGDPCQVPAPCRR